MDDRKWVTYVVFIGIWKTFASGKGTNWYFLGKILNMVAYLTDEIKTSQECYQWPVQMHTPGQKVTIICANVGIGYMNLLIVGIMFVICAINLIMLWWLACRIISALDEILSNTSPVTTFSVHIPPRSTLPFIPVENWFQCDTILTTSVFFVAKIWNINKYHHYYYYHY